MGNCQGCKSKDANSSKIKTLQKQNELLSKSLIELTGFMSKGNKRSILEKDILNSMIPKLIRIVGGKEVEKGAYPECCLIGKRNNNGTISWFCTGVLIDKTTVLSAAHCISSTSTSFVVAFNLENVYGDLADQDTEIIDVRRVSVNRDYYNHRLGANDISVLILQQEAKTEPVPWATTNQINDANEVSLVGFGNDDKNSTRGFGVKREVMVDIVSIRRSNEDNLNRDEATFGYESDLEFVAGGEGFDSCNGDSGGPAYIEVNGERLVAGLTSRAVSNYESVCGDGGIYTRVDTQLEFIKSVQNEAGIFS